MRFLKLPLIVLLCLALMLPAFAQDADDTRLYFVCRTMPTGSVLQTLQLAQAEFAAEGFDYPLACGEQEYSRASDIVLIENSALPAEGFSISADGTLYYADEDGLLYGLRTILKMLLSDGITPLTDAPDTAQRVLMLDCARKYFSKEFICNLIAQMSWIGFNALELHLTEEQGIRADIWDEAYFQSENDYSWICGSERAYWVYDCPDPDAGKYLTAAELIDILQTAEKYHIEIIPSFNTPGHSEYLCNVVENRGQFSFVFDGQSYQTADIASDQYSLIDFTDPTAKAFVHSVLLDYAKFFAAYGCTNFNICADEVSLGAISYDAFTSYVNETAARLQSLGYRVRAFNDFLCYDGAGVALNEDIEIVYWHTPYPSAAADAQTFLDQGRTVYNAIQNYSYYALRVFNTPGYEDRPSWGLDARDENNTWWAFNRATAERIYDEWNPTALYEYTDSKKTVAANAQLGGSYFLIWCDYAGLADEAEIWSGKYPLLDRLWAHGAKSWTWQIDLSYAEFSEKIQNFYEFSGFTGCSEPISLPSVSGPSYAGSLLTVSAVERFRHSEVVTSEAAFRSLLAADGFPCGAFGRKMS